METTQQLNYNECGVCVINTLVKYFYKKDIKSELLKNANITSDGLSIFDFETLSHNYGIECETYRITQQELKDIEIKQMFVTIFSLNNANHYVIAKKRNKMFEIWDSVEGDKKISEKEYFERFTGIIIFVNKSKNKNIIREKSNNIFLHIDIKFLLLSLFMQIAIIILAVIGANYLSKTISECFTNNDYANTIIISIFFILVFVINALIKYLCFLISVKRIKLNYLILTSQVLSALKNKNANFFNKVNKNYIYILDHSINTIITYNVVEVSNFISAFLFTFILIIYIGFVAPIFISLCVFTSIILGSLGYIECKYKQKMLNRATNNGTNNSENCAQYIRHIENNYSPHAIKNLMNKFKHNYFEYITIFTHSSKFNGGINMVNELIEKLLLVVSIVISSYMLDKYFAYDIGKIILLITLIGMYFNNVRTIVNFISLHVEYKIMHEIFVNILNLGNKSQGKYEIKCVKNIFYKNKQINNGGYIYEDTNEFKNILTKYIDSENTLKINGINIKDIKNEWIDNNIIVLDSYQKIDPELIIKNIQDNQTLIDFIKNVKFDIRNAKCDDVGCIQLLNILFCTSLKNKIIVFDNCMKDINKKYLDYIKNKIMPKIKRDNKVIYIKRIT